MIIVKLKHNGKSYNLQGLSQGQLIIYIFDRQRHHNVDMWIISYDVFTSLYWDFFGPS